MEPVTHALTSLALARAGQTRLPRFGTAMLVAAGVAPDLDYASYLGGAGSFLRFDRSLLHSLPSSILLACAIAGAFCWLDTTRRAKNPGMSRPPAARLSFTVAFFVSAIGITGHLLLDVASGVGVQLLWPFRARWFALNLLSELDPWILILLAAGLLLPALLRLVSEEIGERKKSGGGEVGAVVVLALLLVYVSARGYFHSHAVDLLESRDYHGRTPLSAGAFPLSASPFEWRGVVSTDNTIEEVGVPVLPNSEFDAERSLTYYKPEDSPALQAGERTAVAQRFLTYARFPLASVVRPGEGYRFELRDARFAERDSSPANIMVRVEMRGDLQITSEEFEFESRR